MLLKSDELVHRIQKKDTETKLAKLVLFVEISNFTKDCLKGEDLSIINGDSDPLIFWQPDEDEIFLPIIPTIIIKRPPF